MNSADVNRLILYTNCKEKPKQFVSLPSSVNKPYTGRGSKTWRERKCKKTSLPDQKQRWETFKPAETRSHNRLKAVHLKRREMVRMAAKKIEAMLVMTEHLRLKKVGHPQHFVKGKDC